MAQAFASRFRSMGAELLGGTDSKMPRATLNVLGSLAGGALGGCTFIRFSYPQSSQAAGCVAVDGRVRESDGSGTLQGPDIFDKGYRIERQHSCTSDSAGHTRCEVLSQIIRGHGPDATVVLTTRSQQDLPRGYGDSPLHFRKARAASREEIRNNDELALALDEFLAASEDLEQDILSRGGAPKEVVDAMRDFLAQVRRTSENATAQSDVGPTHPSSPSEQPSTSAAAAPGAPHPLAAPAASSTVASSVEYFLSASSAWPAQTYALAESAQQACAALVADVGRRLSSFPAAVQSHAESIVPSNWSDVIPLKGASKGGDRLPDLCPAVPGGVRDGAVGRGGN